MAGPTRPLCIDAGTVLAQSQQATICAAYALALRTLRAHREDDCCDIWMGEDHPQSTSISVASLGDETVWDLLDRFESQTQGRTPAPGTGVAEADLAAHSTALVFSEAGKRGSEHGSYDFVLCFGGESSKAGNVAVDAVIMSPTVEPQQIVRLLDRLNHILRQLVTCKPTTMVRELDLCSPDEVQQILCWNSTPLPRTEDCVHHLFIRQLLQRADAQAVEAWDLSLTYRELDVLSSRLAGKLVSLGVGPEIMVPFCFEKSGFTVVATLAILRAGGTCVPLDPAAPHARLLQITSQIGAKLALTSLKHAETLAGIVSDTLSIDKLMLSSLHDFERPLQDRAVPGNTAFVMFTSGSTGQPKGIMLPHHALATSMQAHGEAWNVGFESRVFQFSAYTFDVAVADTFTTLGRGGCVCIPSEEARLSDLAQTMRQMRANWCLLTPTVANTIQPSDVPCLKTLVLGGEMATRQHLETWAEHVRLINAWGLAECSVYSSGTRTVLPSSSPNKVGHAIGCRLWISDPTAPSSLVPLGCEGEILIEGNTLATGYVNDATKTEQAFAEVTIGGKQGLQDTRRIFRTGDLGYYDDDGGLILVGRKDTQIKLRGLRIELGDIEHHLRQLANGADDVVVEVVQDTGAEPILAAFISYPGADVKHDSMSLSGSPMPAALCGALHAVHRRLGVTLQAYMLPSLYIPLRSMPTTATGKRDRKKLKAMATNLPSAVRSVYSLSSSVKTKPQTAAEESLRAMWSTVLGLPTENIGREDNFFRLGGDSLTVMRLVGAAKRVSLRINVSDVFRLPVLSDLAEAIPNQAQMTIGTEKASASFALVEGLQDPRTRGEILTVVARQCNIAAEAVDDAWPCTALQEALVSLAMKRPGTYTAQYVFSVSDAPSLERLKVAWNVVASHAQTLRSRIITSPITGPLQVVLAGELIWQSFGSLETHLRVDQERPMSFGSTLARFACSHYGREHGGGDIVVTLHHALYDGWSLQLLLDSVANVYQGMKCAELAPLSGLIDYIHQTSRTEEIRFWSHQLHACNAIPFPSGPVSGKPCSREEAVAKLSIQYSKPAELDVTTSTIIRAAWAVTLSRHCESKDIVFGVTLSGRNAPVSHITDIAGPTICTVPIRIMVEEHQTIRNLLRQVQADATAMIPFEHTGLQHIGRIGADAQRAITFQNLLVVQPQTMHDLIKPLQEIGIELSLPNGDGDFHDYPLVVECALSDTGIEAIARYDASIISPDVMDVVLNHFGEAIKYMTQHLDGTVADIDLFGAFDKALVAKWNKAPVTDVQLCVHDLIEQQIANRAHDVAVEGWDGYLTYGELGQLSDILAAYLVEQFGIGPGSLVPFCFEKSIWATVAQLAILKAGSACVGLNPGQPLNRLLEIVKQSGAQVVVTSADHAHTGRDLCLQHVAVSVDLFQKLKRSMSGRPLGARASPQDAAFVVFTSGSTGKPKGIVLEHHAMSTSIAEHGKVIGISQRSRTLQFASYSFDISIGDTFSTLAYGGCVCVPSEEERLQDLAGAVTKYRANLANLTSTVAGLMEPDAVPGLRTMTLSGEAVKQEIVRTWATKVHLIILYGPAEASIWCTANPNTEETTLCSNIGFGMGARNWIMDSRDHRRFCPVGCVGEILVEGPIVARGYLGDEVKTANSFVRDAATLDDIPKIMYKTGDLARYNVDGSMHFSSRIDTQVKLRGQRIELAEIEFALRNYLPSARNVVADMALLDHSSCGSASREAYIVAFYTMPWDTATGPDAVNIVRPSTEHQKLILGAHEQILDTLPNYMVPSYYVPLTDLPTLPASGKTDRRKLRALVEAISADELPCYTPEQRAGKEPETDMERAMQALWHSSLGFTMQTAYREDNYFRLGGHSISAIAMTMHARQQGLELKVPDIFRYPRLSDMAERLTTRPSDSFLGLNTGRRRDPPKQWVRLAALACAVPEDNIESVYPCSALQEGLFALSLQHAGTYMSQTVLTLPSNVDMAKFRLVCRSVFALHPILRTRIVDISGAGLMQAVVRDEIAWHTVDDLQTYLEAGRQGGAEFGAPLCRLAVRGNKLLIAAHHAVYDGWSWEIIYNDILHKYRGQAIDVNSRATFKDFIDYLQDTEPDDTLKFWAKKLDQSNTAFFPAQPGEGYLPKVDSSVKRRLTLTLDKNLAQTMPTIIQVAWSLVTAVYAGSDSITFGMLLSGRNAPVADIGSIAGPTIAAVPFQTAIDLSLPTKTLLDEVRRWNIDVVGHEHLGLQRIRRINAQTATATGFQTQLVVQPKIDGQTALQRLGISVEQAAENGFGTYPLTMECEITAAGVETTARFDSRLLSVSQMGRVVNFFHTILQRINAAGHNTDLAELVTIDDADRNEIEAWQSAKHDQAVDCVHEAFQRQAILQPHATALASFDGDLTYYELDRLSSTLSHRLSGLGIGPEDIVLLCFDKSLWVVVCMLAVLKAGGACTSVDTALPDHRLRTIRDAAGAKLALTDAAHQHCFTDIDVQTLVISEAFVRSLPHNDGNACTTTEPSDLAFLVFTSGSTGTPKGIMLEHRSVCTASRGQASILGIRPGARCLQFSAYAYDVHISDIFTTLMHGGCVAIPSEYERYNDLAGSINRLRANRAYLTPTVATLIEPEDVPMLEVMVLGGESLTTDLVDRWGPHVVLWNAYGPSETTNWVCAQKVHAGSAQPSTIGFPENASAWIVDQSDHNVLLPVGCVGELLVSGPTLARGYIQDPEKTAAAFVHRPFWHQGHAQQRFYKTGDLVRYDNLGSLLYIGRKDIQVKVHGQRLELAEVQSCIMETEGVHTAVVTMPKLGLCKGRLLGVLSVGREQDDNDEGSLRVLTGAQLEAAYAMLPVIQGHLTKKLAPWMIPAVWVFVDCIPRSATGKVNRRAVEDLVVGLEQEHLASIVRSTHGTEMVQPRTDIERKLQSVWADVLNLSPTDIGVHHSFTSLGGDSISAIQAVSRCRAQGVSVTVQDILISRSIAALCPKVKAVTAPTFSRLAASRFPLLMLGEAEAVSLENDLKRLPSVSRLDDVEDAYPCSPLQDGILISQTRDSSLYHIENYFQVVPPKDGHAIDVCALLEAWKTVVKRHTILRTVFVAGLDQTNSFWQVVLRHVNPFTLVSSASPDADGSDIVEALKKWDSVSFTNDTVAHRLVAMSSNDATVYCRLDINHALVDAHATQLMLNDLVRAYENTLGNVQAAPLYSSYISHLVAEPAGVAITFWTDYLRGSQPCLFPALNDGERGQTNTYTETVHFAAMTEMLQQCRHLQVTFASVVQLVWALVLQTYTNEDDVLFGCLVSGRDLPVPDAETTLGPFVNMLVCRAQVDRSQKVAQTLEQMRDQFLHGLGHQTASLGAIQHSLGLGGSPLFNTSMSLHKVTPCDQTAEHHTAIRRMHDEDPTEFDVNLVIGYSKTAFDGQIVFNAKHVSKAFGRLVVDTFEHILASILISPDCTIGEVSRLGPSNEEQLLALTPPKAEPIEQCVHAAFEEQVERDPNALAITSWDGDLTYCELNELANKLSYVLIAAGVRPNTIVPLCFEKCLWVVVAQLAVLKAGAAVLTLDTTHPSERLHVMVECSKASVILAHPDRVHRLSQDTLASVQLILLNEDLIWQALPAAKIPEPAVQPGDLAFIVFTSGSTGLPKGIMLEHQAVRTASQRHAEMFNVAPGSRCFQFSAFAFDVHITDIFVPLQYGATICMPSESERMDDLAGAINRFGASDAYLTPTVGMLFGPADVPCLKKVLMGGEPLSRQIAKKWSGDVFVVNALGPSETSNWVSYGRVLPGTCQPLNVGKAVGLSAWLVEPSSGHELVPLGAIGEVCAESPCLARGYLHDTEKTDASFLTDPPFLLPNGRIGRRVYCLGDLVRANSDGSMVYVGRKDNQIKVHGQRLESSEVEVVLAEAAEVRYVLVSRPKAGLCADQTVAVLALQNTHDLTKPALTVLSDDDRTYAQEALARITELAHEKLAGWMMPTVWVVVNHIPSSASGKLDRNTVRNWLDNMTPEVRVQIRAFSGDGQGVLPRNEVEIKLQRVWSRVLNTPIERTFVDSAFTRLGGDSISAIQIISRCRSEEQLAISVKDVLTCHTIAELALRARHLATVSVANEADEDSGVGEFELSPIQKMFYGGASKPENHYNQSFLLQMRKKITAIELGAAMKALVDHHAMLRGHLVARTPGQRVQKVQAYDPACSIDVQRHQVQSMDTVESILHDAQRRFEVTTGPLYGVLLIDVGESEQLTFITIHHLIIDLVSWRILLHDLEQTLVHGHLSAPRTLSFRRWTEEQSKVARNLNPNRAFPFTIPPGDFNFWQMQRNPNRSGNAVTTSFRLCTATTSRWLGRSTQTLNAEPLDMLLTAIMVAFRSVFPERPVPAIFNESHGREPWDDSIDISRTVGWFTTMYPIHCAGLSNSTDTALRAAVCDVRETRARIPKNGWEYFNLRYSGNSAAAATFTDHDDMEIVFNYAGIYQQLERADGLFRRIPYHSIDMHMTSPDTPQQGLFSIGAGVENQELYLDFTYNQAIAHQGRIKEWVRECERLLREMADLE